MPNYLKTKQEQYAPHLGDSFYFSGKILSKYMGLELTDILQRYYLTDLIHIHNYVFSICHCYASDNCV